MAHELNYELFKFGKIDSIEFIKVQFSNGVEYEGRTIPEIPIGKSKEDKLVNLPEKIAELVYGCYFQCLFDNNPFVNCFSFYDNSSNGYHDANSLASGLTQFYIGKDKRKVLYPFLKEQYFNKLKDKKEVFEPLFRVNPINYLDERDFGFKADIIKVFELTLDVRAKHRGDYFNFINRIKDIINWEKVSRLREDN